MSNGRRPLVTITFSKDKVYYSLVSIWAGRQPGSYAFNLDKGTDKRPAIGFLEALKSWAGGNGYINIDVHSEREPRGNAPSRERSFGGGEDPDDLPF